MQEFGKPELVTDFLQTFFIVDGDVTSRGETRDRLLEPFSDTERDSYRLDARFSDISKAKGLLNDLVTYSEYYNDIIDTENYGIELGEDGDDEIQEGCNRILTRLNNANTSIWEPLVLAVYHDVREDSIGQQDLLLNLLRDIESMAVRSFAAMDTNVRDSAYAAAMETYHDEGLDNEIRDTLTDIESDDPQAVGEDLVISLYQAEWRRPWGKQILRKIASENFSTDEAVVLRRLNMDNDLVHLEHIFPESPLLGDDNKYDWFQVFFRTAESDGTWDLDSDDSLEIYEVIEGLIGEGDEDTLKLIAEEYQDDIGNLALLRSTENLQIGNKLFAEKLVKYNSSQGFCELQPNQYICNNPMEHTAFDVADDYKEVAANLDSLDEDNWEEIKEETGSGAEGHNELQEELKERMESLADELSELNFHWSYNDVTNHRADVVATLCESISISEGEFEGVDFEELSREETGRRNDVIATNMMRRLS